MNDAMAIKASYADWKLIKTRGVVQVVMEIPLHEADAAYQALGGMPDPSKERWFAIAALDLSKGADASPPRGADSDLEDRVIATAPRPRKPVAADKRLAQQAGIACADPLFQKFIGCTNEADAANAIRKMCGVGSRSEIAPGTPEGQEWQNIYGRFTLWRDYPQYADCQNEMMR